VLARAIAGAVTLSPRQSFPFDTFCGELIAIARTPEIRDKLTQVQTLVADQVPPSEAAQHLGRGVAVHESMPFALYAFLRYTASFEECLLCAVLNGGDRDTLGAMACALSGTYLGIEAVPPSWLEKLENRPYIQRLARDLVDLTIQME